MDDHPCDSGADCGLYRCGRLISIDAQYFQKPEPLNEGELFRILTEELIPDDDPYRMAVSDQEIVLLYDEEGLLNVYDHNGTFQYGIQIITLQNGKGNMEFQDGLLYVASRGARQYVFDGDQLHSTFTANEDPASYRRMRLLLEGEPNHKSGDTIFYLVEHSVMKAVDGGPMETVISLPQRNPDIDSLVFFISICVVALLQLNRDWIDKKAA